MNTSVDAESSRAVQHTVYLFDGFQLDVTRRKLVSSGGLVQPLNSRAMEALLLLVANAGDLVEKRRLMQTVWPNAIVEDNNLNQCVLAIRKALGETAGSNRYVMTVPGRGYRFVTPVHMVVQESALEAPVADTAATQLHPSWLWLGGAILVCIIALTIQLLRIEVGADVPAVAAVEITTPSGPDSPEIVLRLHDPPDAHDGGDASGSTAELAGCLAASPDMELHVQVQLVTKQGQPVWQGDYVAAADDRRALRVNGSSGAASCRDVTAALRKDQ